MSTQIENTPQIAKCAHCGVQLIYLCRESFLTGRPIGLSVPEMTLHMLVCPKCRQVTFSYPGPLPLEAKESEPA